MNDPDILAIISKALAGQRLFYAPPEITLDTQIDGTLDAIDLICVVCAIEEALGVDIPDAVAESWTCVGDIVASVAALREAA